MRDIYSRVRESASPRVQGDVGRRGEGSVAWLAIRSAPFDPCPRSQRLVANGRRPVSSSGRDDRGRLHGGVRGPGEAERPRGPRLRHGLGHARGDHGPEGPLDRGPPADPHRHPQRGRRRGYRRPKDAALLPLRRLGQHRLQDGGHRRGDADTRVPVHEGAPLDLLQG
jgi:hypothetical protein